MIPLHPARTAKMEKNISRAGKDAAQLQFLYAVGGSSSDMPR